MRILLILVILQSTVSADRTVAQGSRPTEVVQRLYHEVVARHPLGVPHGTDRAAIWPLLSKRLITALETRDACDRDWQRKHRNANPPVKPPTFNEDGLFSGGNEMGYINGAKVEPDAKVQKDGSYFVYVDVWSYLDEYGPPVRDKKIYRWRVAARVISENGSFAVDDILLGLKNQFGDDPHYMSKMLTMNCEGRLALQ